jgi:hypothetical protein
MSNEVIETGWKRFLDRLRRLWGKFRDRDIPAAAAATAVEGTSATPAPAQTPAPSLGS